MIGKIVLALALLSFAPASLLALSSEHMTGAYVEADITDDKVKEAADFAVKIIDKGTLVNITSAKVQVVAGLNYELLLEIAQKDCVHHSYKAVVFVPLPVSGLPMRLTSSQEIGIL